MNPFKVGDRVKCYENTHAFSGLIHSVLDDYVTVVYFNAQTEVRAIFHYKQCRKLKKPPTLGRTWYIPKEWVGSKGWKTCFEKSDGPFIRSEIPKDISNYMVIREVLE